MKKNIFILTSIVLMLSTLSVKAEQTLKGSVQQGNYYIKEADQSLAGYYKQQINYQKWKDIEIQKSKSDLDSGLAFQEGIKNYEKALKRQQAWVAFFSALAGAANQAAGQYQQMQAAQAQQNAQLREQQRAFNQQIQNYQSQMNKQSAGMRSYNSYMRQTIMGTLPQSTSSYKPTTSNSNGYPILDPYTKRY